MYSVARINGWISVCVFNNSEEMKNTKKETIKYFVSENENMLTENLDLTLRISKVLYNQKIIKYFFFF
jgi:hypothetical protein